MKLLLPQHKPISTRSFLIKTAMSLFTILLIVSIVTLFIPVVVTPIRLIYLATISIGILLVLFSFIDRARRNKTIGMVAGVLMIGLLSWFLLAGHSTDREGLRKAYFKQLTSYMGSPYYWGGERHNGIDCSGLARTAFYEAIIREGIRERNPRLLGPELWKFWFRDLTARAMLHETYHYTHRIGQADKLAGYHAKDLKIGDIALTYSGIHVLVYYGNDTWIEASPYNKAVVANKATADSKRGYFNDPVTFFRWWLLD